MIKNSIFININRKENIQHITHRPQLPNIQKVRRYEFFTSGSHFYYSYYMAYHLSPWLSCLIFPNFSFIDFGGSDWLY